MSLFAEIADDSVHVTVSSGLSDDHAYVGFDSGDHYNSFHAGNFAADSDSVTDSPKFNDSSYTAGDDGFGARRGSEIFYSSPIYGYDGGFFPEENGKESNREYGGVGGPILPDMEEMRREEGFALREWRRQNAIQLEEKEKRERELLTRIIDEADGYKLEFYRKKTITCETGKATNREKEKLFVASLEKFYAEADKDYWKSIAELVPNEVPTIGKKRGKTVQDQEKKPSVVVVQGPKPGKPTDLSRMRQILVKLKHNTPAHLKHSPPPPASVEDAKPGCSSKTEAIVTQPNEIVAAA